MTSKTAALIQPSTVVGALGLGALGGAGARGIRHLWDIYKGKDEGSTVNLPSRIPAKIPVPVEISPDEAQELEAQGVKVKHKIAGFMGDLATGAAMTGGAYAGWSGINSWLDSRRKAKAQEKLDATRLRVQNLLEDNPMPMDTGLHASMKAAEDLFFKGATSLSDMLSGWATNGLDSAAGATRLGIPLGIAGTVLGLSAFNQARNNKSTQENSAIKHFYQHQDQLPSEAELEPVVVERKNHLGIPKAASVKELGDRLKGKLRGGPAR